MPRPRPAEMELQKVKVSEKGLPTIEPQRSWALQSRRARRRGELMYLYWLKADDKDVAISELTEKWGYQKPGCVKAEIEKYVTGDKSVSAVMAAEVEVLRMVRRREVLDDFDAYREEIDRQIGELEEIKVDGGKWVDIEEVDDVGGKHAGVKTRRTRVETELRRLYAERAKSHEPESKTLRDYDTAKSDGFSTEQKVAAAAEFMEAFQHIEKVFKNAVPTDAEVIEDK